MISQMNVSEAMQACSEAMQLIHHFTTQPPAIANRIPADEVLIITTRFHEALKFLSHYFTTTMPGIAGQLLFEQGWCDELWEDNAAMREQLEVSNARLEQWGLNMGMIHREDEEIVTLQNAYNSPGIKRMP